MNRKGMLSFILPALIILSLLPMTTTYPSTAQQPTNDLIPFTYALTQSTSDRQFWTTPPSERVFLDDAVPTETGEQVLVFAAKNEVEPFQVVVKPTVAESVAVSLGDFGAGITAEIYQVAYVPVAQATDNLGRTGPYPDPLVPLLPGATVSLVANQNTAFWFSLAVPTTTPSGDYTTNVQIGTTSIPVTLHVFDFAIPAELHVKSQMNFSHEAVLNAYSVTGTGDDYWLYVDMMKQFFIDHRLTPKAPLWSGGLTSGGKPYIKYDCTTHTFTDEDGIWGFEHPANKYLNGNGFNDGTGFPSFMAMTFRNNDASQDQRPDTFCDVDRTDGDWYTANTPNTPYNTHWFAYMTAIQQYLQQLGYLDKSYYYFANEPQDQADYDAVAWYSQEIKKVAPNFKLMVSEQPKPEIYNHPTYTGAKIDIWLPVLNQYDPEISHVREAEHGEETWVYFLHGTRPPYFNPITLDHPGIESKLTGWFLWNYRIRGLAYYSMNNWSKNPWTDPLNDNHNGDLFMLYPPGQDNQPIAYGSNQHRMVPSIRFELMRDSLEDYEYLYVLNGNQQPVVNQANDADTQVSKMITGLTSYTRDSEFLYNLRRVIGLKNGGEIDAIPDIQPPAQHPRAEGPPASYYLNFQDPAGEPTANPLVVNGNEYMKIGWNAYDETLGYGWFGDMAHVKYQYLSNAPNPLQASIIYDDWGREKTFGFVLPNGEYRVTVSVGWQGKTYQHNKITIEGVSFIDDEASNPYLVRTKEITIKDNQLTMAMGIFDEYTMLNYLDIEPINVATPTPSPTPTETATPTPSPTPSPTPTPIISTLEISPTQGGSLTIQDPATGTTEDIFTITFPTTTVQEPVVIVYTSPITPTKEQPLPTGMSELRNFMLHATTANGEPVTTFALSYTMELVYTEQELAQARVTDKSTLNVAYWNTNDNVWHPMLPCAGCVRAPDDNRLVIMADHFTDYSLMGETVPLLQIYLPIVRR